MPLLERVLFNYFPYVALTVLVVGTIYRFEREQYSWQASSSQMLRSGPRFQLASNLFHLGVLGLVGGHVAGLLVPPAIWHFLRVPDAAHQMMELVMGSLTGGATLVGLGLLCWRRFTDVRVRRTSGASDNLIALLLLSALLVGMFTLPESYQTRDSGIWLHHLSSWAQGIVFFGDDPAAHLQGVPWVFRLHILLGLGVFLVFPFTRLVHVCSAPLGYLTRTYTQIVRARRV